jgi:hypothetical protein
MNKIIITTAILVSFTVTMAAQVFTTFSVKGSLVDPLMKNSQGKIETIVDEIVDIKNLDFKYRLNSGTVVSDSTPIGKDFTKPQYIQLVNANEGKQTWQVVVNQLKISSLPFTLSYSKSNPLDVNAANPKPWAGYGIDYKRTDAIYFGDEGVTFYIAFGPGAKELSYNVAVLAPDAIGGEFAVECSADFKRWSTLATYNSSNSMVKNNVYTHALKSDVKYVRWVYYTRVKQNVTLNNISVN